ncbi:MAG: 5-formyltetrahydrofolate cyclo-ligase [Chlamydiota bacterium]|nr:5-formyltetrahydrofolate cyclo-ligase [Chlamydiota bacterium]
MNGENPSLDKKRLRESALSIRRALSPNRKAEASDEMRNQLLLALSPYQSILSFSPLEGEIDIRPLNDHLMQEGKLLLLREEKARWRPYRVIGDLLPHPKYNLMEPNPKEAIKETEGDIDIAIVPGLAFDPQGHRLGYGKGHYDQLLSTLPCLKWGVAFREQQLLHPLPHELHDIPMDRLYFF